ncbi:MAG: NUDIX domain-containing protein [Bacteroidota bacterium]
MARTEVRYGPRLGREGRIRLGCSGVIFDAEREKVLLTRRTDNGMWCLPGGAMDPGESAEEACIRELWEETGLKTRVARLIGVYSNPDQLVIYPDGNKAHIVALSFEAEVTGGELGLSSETTEVGYFTLEQIQGMELIGQHRQRVEDAFANQKEAFIK